MYAPPPLNLCAAAHNPHHPSAPPEAEMGKPLPPPIDGTKEPSFCFATIVERWPRIVTRIIDQMHKYQPEAVRLYGEEGDADVKSVIHSLSELKYLMGTDKPLRDFADAEPDAALWNAELRELREKDGPENVTWFKAAWIFTECYLYRSVYSFFVSTRHLRIYDPFQSEKRQAYADSKAFILAIGAELHDATLPSKRLSATEERDLLLKHLQIQLWGNKCDLSLSGGDPHSMSATLFKELDTLRPQILSDDLDRAVDALFAPKRMQRLDIALDNAGFELFADLCLADLVLSLGMAQRVVFHGKTIPWFVSDTTHADLDWVLGQLVEHPFDDLRELGELGTRWRRLFAEGRFEYRAHPFWTYGYVYAEMRAKCPDLYEELGGASLLLLKGDLHYRKLVGDRYWPHDTDFRESLCGFEPCPLLALRTLKAEMCAGLSKEAILAMEEKHGAGDTSWMVSSEYAVAQLLAPST